jgi:hypothetical protein
MRKIIIVGWFGGWSKVRIEKQHLKEKYYIGNTVNGIRKYRWNLSMWAVTLLTQGHEPKKKKKK